MFPRFNNCYKLSKYLLTLVTITNNNDCGNYMSSQSLRGRWVLINFKLVLQFLSDICKISELDKKCRLKYLATVSSLNI